MTPKLTIENWLVAVDDAADSLAVFRAWLKAWHDHPMLGTWPVDAFDAVIDDLRLGGLAGWLDSERVAALRRAVCGGDT